MLRVQQKVIRFNDPNIKVYIAYSAGIDSLAVAHFLRHRNPIIYYVNHSLYPWNDAMEEKAREFSKDFNLKFKVFKPDQKLIEDAKAVSSECGGGEEHGARKIRLEAWRELSGESCDLLVCHHLDDYAESHLMNFLRGHEGFKPMEIETIFYDKVRVVRPNLLSEKKDNIAYVEKHGLSKYVFQDPSNLENKLARNRLRRILPELCSIYNFKKKLFNSLVEEYKQKDLRRLA